ncbi:hypothetical protein B0H14DRAFT_3599006 [Mycena olivaceomarginata]|nr:hypothetical protein B0H14DRAFT_3599006 [Mycena olivaceomarginata]
MQPLPVLSPETAAAVQISAQRATDFVIEAATERARVHAYTAALQELRDRVEQLHRRGFNNIYRGSYGHEEGPEQEAKWDRLQAVNTLHHYAAPRNAKILRARFRRYKRLRYFHELEHPPFSHPEFPQHPATLMWHNSVALPAGFSGWTLNNAEVEQPGRLLRAEDDEISRVLTTRPLTVA